MTSRVSRACDGCRVRKVRCNGDQPCSQCANLSLKCVFAPPPGKRKPGVRGRLVAQLRNSQTNGTPVPLPNIGAISGGNVSTTTSPTSSGGSLSPTALPAVTSIAGIVNNPHRTGISTSPQNTHASSDSFSTYSALGSIPSRYNHDFFMSYLSLYEEQVYPVNPIVSPSEMQCAIYNMHNDYQDAALIYAYAAVTINLTVASWSGSSGTEDVAQEMTTLIDLAVRAHHLVDSMPSNNNERNSITELTVTVKRIATCLFLEISMMAFQRHDRAFAVLREAITMLQILNIHQYDNGDDTGTPNRGHHCLSAGDIARLKRAYWEAYIHERFMSTVTGLPCIVPPLSSGVPIGDTTIPPHIDVGFNRLIHLFRVLDGPFLAHWTAQKDSSVQAPEMTAEWIEKKQAELDADETGANEAQQTLALGGLGGFSELQIADLFITRLWLRTLVWQFALSHRLLRSAPSRSSHEGLSLHFPAQRLSSQLRNLVSRLQNASSIIIHGSGILQKLFEITSTVADVLALPLGPGQTEEDYRARLEDFEFLVRFIFGFERTQKEQRDYLREKLGALQRQFTIIDFSELAGLSPNATKS